LNRSLLAAIACVPALLVAPSSISAQLSQPKTERLAGGGVRVINDGPSAWQGGSGWKLLLELTIEPAEGSPGELANPTGILRTSDGRFVVTDMNAPTVRLYDRTGQFIREIGRSGAGPGEYRQPMPTLYRDTLMIHDGGLHRVSVMTLDGKSVRTMAVPNSASCCHPPMVDASGHLVIASYSAKGQLFRRYTLAGQPLDSVVVPQVASTGEWSFASGGGEASYSIPYAAFTVRTMLRDGTLLYGNSREYQLRVTRTGRDTVRLIERRTGSATPIRPTLRDSMFHMLVDRNADLRAVASINDVPKDYPFMTSVFEDGSANIWVLLGGGAPSPMRFDVFTHDGRLLGNVTAPFTWSSPNITFLGDRIGVIGTDDNDLPRIRIYRIVTK
jgi:hypothetical protein